MLNTPTPEQVTAVRDALRAWGFDHDTLTQRFERGEVPSARSRNRARLLDQTREPTATNTLVRWFVFGFEVPSALAVHQHRDYAPAV